MKNNLKNKKGYSVLIVLLLIGFIIVLSTGIYKLVINEMKSNKIMGDYIKAYAGAESAQELGLLDIKNKGYGYIGKIEGDINPKSIILGKNPKDKNKFNFKEDVLISYNNDGQTNNYEGELGVLEYDIIPLFYINDEGDNKTKENKITLIELKVSGINGNLSWNIIGKNSGISGFDSFNSSTYANEKSLENGQFVIKNKSVQDFLTNSDTNYLVLFNSGINKIGTAKLKYTVSSGADTYFTKPRLYITSSGEIGNYRQNIKTKVDNTEFLSILKYSIFSGDI